MVGVTGSGSRGRGERERERERERGGGTGEVREGDTPQSGRSDFLCTMSCYGNNCEYVY